MIITRSINKKRNRNMLLMLLMFYITPIWALGAIGWHWYNEPGPVIIQPKNQKKEKPVTADDQLKYLQKQVREAKARAILYPTEENLKSYLLWQQYVVQNASFFSQMWQKTLLDYPELDYSISHPTENNAQHVLYSEEDKKEDAAINEFRETYGLFFFYRGNNTLDQELAPSINDFATRNKISIVPVSIDGKVLPTFRSNINSKIDHGEAKNLGIRYFPALILVNPKLGKVKPLNYGFISEDELRRRFLQVASDFREGV